MIKDSFQKRKASAKLDILNFLHLEMEEDQLTINKKILKLGTDQ